MKVAGARTRPSGDRLKEALFSSLGEVVHGARVLDLYAGSGALGIEALSRGAAEATFVDNHAQAIAVIHANLAVTGLAKKASVIQAGAEQFLSLPSRENFGVVLIDPPYELGLPSQVLELLAGGGYIDPASSVVVEASARRRPFDAPTGYVLEWERRYGDSVVLHFRLAGKA